MGKTNNQTIAATYNETVEKYIKASPKKVTLELGKWIDKNLSTLNKAAKILEIGSGSGKDADYIMPKGYSVELTDASVGFVNYLKSTGKTARLLNAISDDLGTGYDMVFAGAVFLHFTPEELSSILGKIWLALKKDGRLAFTLKAGIGGELTDRKLNGKRYFYYWQPNDIKEVLIRNGFNKIDIEVIDDYRGKDRHDWLLISVTKDNNRHISADDDDLMDIVDKDDKVIGTINQVDARSLLDTKAGYIRGTVAFIQNKEGKLWTPRRSSDKRIAPNGLDFGVAEHVQSGETYEQGIIRGFKEELFLDLTNGDLQFLGKLDPVPHMPYFFTGVFLYKSNEVKDYNHADYTGYEWLEPQAVIDLIDSGTPSKNALKAAIKKFILKNQ